MIPVIVLAGPTASGKTALAVELAGALGAEVVSADSRQVYRGLDVGTAKPPADVRAAVAHHLIDILDPVEAYNAGSFARDAAAVIERLCASGKTALVCGGTGFYIEALLNPMFDEPLAGDARREEIRRELERLAERHGPQALHDRLAGVDPSSAARLHPNDIQRVSRALELYCLTGRTMTELLSSPRPGSAFRPFQVVLDPPRDLLERNIAARSAQMLAGGWVEEVEGLLAGGLTGDAPGLQSLGYAEVVAHVQGGLTLEQTLEAVNRKTRQYAKRQRTWFRRRPCRLRLSRVPVKIDSILAGWESHLEQDRSG
ncbi:MAG: tRNA (adenosine(37)-N6)-dimethylallyltransferase MiaA [Candidatus Glassbacteria bacterium]|nr:tRNA (adenosine(37)-N6)-dimethylallyltransferase MiaA [Candidatus Glassbacteria bacterium]